MTKQEFTNQHRPEQIDGQHPDHTAVRVDILPNFNPEWFDRTEQWNGNVLPRGGWLFPTGEIINII